MQLYKFDFYALGSDCSVQLYAPVQSLAQKAAVAAEREAARIERKYSRYQPQSELYRINTVAGTGGSIVVDPESAGLLDYAFAAYRKSGGLFDITSGLLRQVWDFTSARLPDDIAIGQLLARVGLEKIKWQNPTLIFEIPGMQLDFGGLGKEYAADRAAEICVASGIQRGLIEFGGDIPLIGPQLDGTAWPIGIRHPRNAATSIAKLELSLGAVATSGDYERYFDFNGRRYCHILNPRTGWPAQGLRSVTVLGDNCLVVGTLATTAMLKGRHAGRWLQSLGVRHLIMDEDGVLSGTECGSLTQSC
jgi:thiamine biosynthesis lipoprotein